jgi:GNAT superfamily N-acetyltransferase
MPVNEALSNIGLPKVDRAFMSLCLACNGALLRRHHHGDCRRLVDDSIPPAEGLNLPDQCFSDGIVYGVIAEGQVASVAFMENRRAELGVVTAPAYRRRGYAQTVVSTITAHVTDAGGEAVYFCSPDNSASIATAHSVGFVPYGVSLILGAPWAGA